MGATQELLQVFIQEYHKKLKGLFSKTVGNFPSWCWLGDEKTSHCQTCLQLITLSSLWTKIFNLQGEWQQMVDWGHWWKSTAVGVREIEEKQTSVSQGRGWHAYWSQHISRGEAGTLPKAVFLDPCSDHQRTLLSFPLPWKGTTITSQY